MATTIDMGPLGNHLNNGWKFTTRVLTNWYYMPVNYSTPIYNNQSTIDALNAILANCDKLKNEHPSHFACDPAFIAKVEQQLLAEMSKSQYNNPIFYRPVTYIR